MGSKKIKFISTARKGILRLVKLDSLVTNVAKYGNTTALQICKICVDFY